MGLTIIPDDSKFEIWNLKIQNWKLESKRKDDFNVKLLVKEMKDEM